MRQAPVPFRAVGANGIPDADARGALQSWQLLRLAASRAKVQATKPQKSQVDAAAFHFRTPLTYSLTSADRFRLAERHHEPDRALLASSGARRRLDADGASSSWAVCSLW